MNKTSKILFAVVCLFAFATVGFANATPRTLKECNMLYSTSENPDKWLPVPGNQVSNFKLTLDASVEWYYLDIKFIKPDIVDSETLFGFFLTSPTDPAFWAYWNAKGVNAAATPSPDPAINWKHVMWHIISDTETMRLPMFALYCDGSGNYDLYDGLLRYAFGQHASPLRVNGDYPKGTYTFTCVLPFGSILEGTVMTIEFR